MRVTFATDLAGALPRFRELFERAWRERREAVLLGGDLLPAPSLASSPEDAVTRQRRFLTDELRPLLRQLARIAPRCRVLYLLGDEDAAAADELAAELEDEGLWRGLHGQLHEGPGWSLVGWSHVHVCGGPWLDRQRRDLDDHEPPEARAVTTVGGAPQRVDAAERLRAQPSLLEELAALPEPAGERATYVLHAPPYGSKADLSLAGEHVGSMAVRAWIEARQPGLVLCGHARDAPYRMGTPYDQIGRTLICNPGQGQRLHAVEARLDDARRQLDHRLFGVSGSRPTAGITMTAGDD